MKDMQEKIRFSAGSYLFSRVPMSGATVWITVHMA